MVHSDFATYNEIISQTAAWKEAVKAIQRSIERIKELNLNIYTQVLFIGCGSTYYLSLAAASLFQSVTGIIARAMPSSELLLFPESVYSKGKQLMIAISRSGSTSETLRVARDFKANHHGDLVLITNYNDSPLAAMADLVISIDTGREQSIVQTRSFASMFVAASAFAYVCRSSESLDLFNEDYFQLGDKLIENYHKQTFTLGNDPVIQRVFFLGSGFRYGLACEAALKLKEMSQLSAEPFHFLEFRHGPISMVDRYTLVLGLMSENAFVHEEKVIKDIQVFGGKTLTIGNNHADISFHSTVPEMARGVFYLPFFQLFAYRRAIYNKKDPDNPHNLTAVVQLNLDS
jgi:glucosamine--fructose-6-phosphate aminotransferase (isomerizing)